jgi:hypothetical protein
MASVAVLLVQVSAVLRALYRSADNAAGLMLPSSDPAGTVTTLGNHPWFEAWWFMRATVGLPDHLGLWKAAPFVVAALGIAAIGWCAYTAIGRAGAAVSVVVLVSLSPQLRAVLLVPGARVGLLLHAASLCGALLVVDRLAITGRMTRGRWALAGVLVIAFTAAGATDHLLVPAAVAPYVAASVVCLWRDRSAHSRVLVGFAAVTAVVSCVGSALVTQAMARSGVVADRFQVGLLSFRDLRTGIGSSVSLLATLAGGRSTSLPGLLSIAGLGVACVALCLAAHRIRSSAGTITVEERARTLYVSFWACALIFSLGAFAGTTASVDNAAADANQRYLLGAWAALAALSAAAARRAAAANVLLVCVAVFGLANVAGNVVSVAQPWEFGPNPTTAAAVEQFVLAEHAAIGYGGYWDVMPFGLDSGGRLTVEPIAETPLGVWGKFEAVANTAWFRQHRGDPPTFLVVDSRPSVPAAVVSPPPQFGPPVADRRFGPFTVYIYGHDLARDM